MAGDVSESRAIGTLFDPVSVRAPDDTGSDVLRRFDYQVHVCARAVLEMLARDEGNLTCEHLEDAVIYRVSDGVGRWAYCQIKTRDGLRAWGLSAVISSKALKSLWRTWNSLPDDGKSSAELWVLFEGVMDPADAPMVAMSDGRGRHDEDCVKRVARHLGATPDEVSLFLDALRTQGQASRADIVNLNLSDVSNLSLDLTGHEIREQYRKICELIQTAMQGKLGARWPLIARQEELPNAKKAKRITLKALADLGVRKGRASGVRLREIATSDDETSSDLVRKLRTGGASQGVIEMATELRANADHSYLEAIASGTLVVDPDDEVDMDRRLLAIAKGVSAELWDQAPRPADRIYNRLLERLESSPPGLDRHPHYGSDPMLLMGRACDLSDQCLFAWGQS